MSEERSIIVSSTDSPQNIETFLNLLIQWKKEAQSLNAAQAAKLKDATRAFFKDKQESTIAFMASYQDQPDDKIGFMWLQRWNQQGKITGFSNELWVRPDCRGKGIGQLLFEQGLAWAVDMQASQFWLNVSADNLGAIRFYEKYGFEIQPEDLFHKYVENPPTWTPLKPIIIQERKKGESDQAMWRLSRALHGQNHTDNPDENLRAEKFKQWQALWDFDKEEALVVFKVYEKNQGDEEALIGYAWGEKCAAEKNNPPIFILQEWMIHPDHPDREKIALFLLKFVIHNLFQRGFQHFSASILTDFQRASIKKLGFKPTNYLMTKTFSRT